jgi:microcystin-dependent protein
MSEPFLSEIKIISFNFPPKGWAFCNGQLLPINQNQALFSLLGTTYGGNGQTTFALPDLRGKVPIHFGNGFILGQTGGETAHTLNINEMPSHLHFASASGAAPNATSPQANFWSAPGAEIYAAAPDNTMRAGTVANVGGSQPHDNMSPYLVLNFIIALIGIFPSRN